MIFACTERLLVTGWRTWCDVTVNQCKRRPWNGLSVSFRRGGLGDGEDTVLTMELES